MRPYIAILSALLAMLNTFANAQSKDPWKIKPTTLREALTTLDQLFDDTAKYSFMMFPEQAATSTLHFGFGMWMRNHWGLWGRSSLKKEMEARGFGHPDDMSSAILTAYHRSLRQVPLSLEGLADECRARSDHEDGYNFWADSTVIRQSREEAEATLALFHPGDTIVIHLYASYRKLFTTYASGLKGIAVVQGRVNDQLKVKLISLAQKRRHTAERRVGETFSTQPSNCSLIPPAGWKSSPLVLPEGL